MTHDLKTQGEWKTHITMEINFFFLKILLKGVLSIQSLITQKLWIVMKLMKSMKLFYKNIKKAENNQLLHYKCNKKSLNRGGSYIDSPKRLKNKKVTIDRKT